MSGELFAFGSRVVIYEEDACWSSLGCWMPPACLLCASWVPSGKSTQETHNPEVDDLLIKNAFHVRVVLVNKCLTSFVEFSAHEIGTIFAFYALTFQSASI